MEGAVDNKQRELWDPGLRSGARTFDERLSPGWEGRLVDLARSEAVKAELAHRLEGRSSRELDSDEREALWRKSVRFYNARRREEMRAAWWKYHQGQAARHRAVREALIARHEDEAAKLMDVRPEGAA